VILTSLTVAADELEARTGWAIKPEGACKGEVCVPLPAGTSSGSSVDAELLAGRLGMPLVRDEAHDLWALGPDAGVTGRALSTAVAPELVLPDLRNDKSFALSSLRGQKVLLVAWASW
jgi:hypothetical protein